VSALSNLRREIVPGAAFDVTNHYITREDHPSFGTTRRAVERRNGSSFYLSITGRHAAKGSKITWPKSTQVTEHQDDLGATYWRVYGGGAGQQPDDLFLTIRPVGK
jgi:hypothetical protein